LGRRAEALAAFQDARRLIVEELGIEPAPELRAAPEDPGRDVSTQLATAGRAPASAPVNAGPSVAVQPCWPIPSQLPTTVGDFTGRAEPLRHVLALLAADSAESTLAIVGTAGAGKTTLAIRASHQVGQFFPDGMLYVDLRGARACAPPPKRVIAGLLLDLGFEPRSVPDDEVRLVATYRSLLHGRRMLLVLDDARDASQIRPLLPGTPTCRVLLTSRNSHVDHVGADTIRLTGLDHADAIQLVRRVVGAQRLGAEPEAVEDLLRSCGGSPLALRIAAARLAARPHWPIRWLAERLHDERRRLDEPQEPAS
jgi:hypothetical protein